MSIHPCIARTGAIRIAPAFIVTLCVALLAGGCGERKKPAEIVALEGKIEKLTINNKDNSAEVIVQYHSEKHGKITGKALITPETEIMINGVAADVSQLQTGERIRGDVLVERQGDERKYTVKKIFVDRPVAQPGPTAEPASPTTPQPATSGG